jgi:hypothetical protein
MVKRFRVTGHKDFASLRQRLEPLLLFKKEKFMSQRGITINDMQLAPVDTDLKPKSYGRNAGVRHTP